MAKKYYAVRRGLTPGIYLTWADCKKNTDGFSGAEYKSFASLPEAEAYLSGDRANLQSTGAGTVALHPTASGDGAVALGTALGLGVLDGEVASLGTALGLGVAGDGVFAPDSGMVGTGADALSSASVLAEVAATAHVGEAVAYVDGSYRGDTKEYACGAVLIYDGRVEHFSKKYSDPEMAKMRNVAGEIMGSMLAMRYCLDHHIPRLVIYHDYEGIARWCTGEWKATKLGTASYRDFYQKASEQMQIRFVKVKGHAGNPGNELADQLARAALGLARI